MYSGDDHSHHRWQGNAFKRTTVEFSESLAGLLCQVFLYLFEWLLNIMSPNDAMLDASDV